MSMYLKLNAIALIAWLVITEFAYAAPPPWQLGPVSGQLCATLDSIVAGEIMNISTLAAFKNKEFDADKAMSLLMNTQQYIQQKHIDFAKSVIVQQMEPSDKAFVLALQPQLITVYQKCDLWISRFGMSKPENVSDADYATMENYCKTEPQNLHKNYCEPPPPDVCKVKGTRVGKTAWQKFKRGAGLELCTKLVEVDTLIAELAIDNPLTPCDDAFNDAVDGYIGEQVEKARQSKECISPDPVNVALPPTTATVEPPKRPEPIIIDDRYQDNGDGTVTDITTNLMWKRCSEGQHWNGSTCTGEAGNYTWASLMPLGEQKFWSEFAGHGDWRLPKLHELLSLVYCSSGIPTTWKGDMSYSGTMCAGEYQKPTIDTTVFPSAPSEPVWSSTPFPGGVHVAWIVHFSTGNCYSDAPTSYRPVRLVRTAR